MQEPWLRTTSDLVQAGRSSAHTPPTFVVTCYPFHAVSESHFSSNQVSENSNLIHKTQMHSAAISSVMAISSINIIYVSLRCQVKHFADFGFSTLILLTRKNPEAQAAMGLARAVVMWARYRVEGHCLAVFI